MRVVEIVAVEGEQAGAAGQGYGPVTSCADAAFACGEAGVAQPGITESFHQPFKINVLAVVVHDQGFPLVQTLGDAAGHRCFQLFGPVLDRDQKADGGCPGHRRAAFA